MTATLGITTDNQPLLIGDTERRSGLYILGKPRMGKSWLIINMILQDLENNHGVFFLDPQGDTVDQLISRLPFGLGRPLVYDFEDQDKILNLNPLGGNRTDPASRSHIFAKTKAIFDKLWKNTFEEKPWLQLIIQNTIYAFIETSGYTLAEFPMFFRDREFREFLISKMQYNLQVKDYWLKTFASKARRDQDNIMEAAQTRCEIMLAHPAVRCLLGYGAYMCLETRMNTNGSTFIKLSTKLPYEVKKIIGTVVINEMKFAIDRRPTASPLYCLYIDEFQNFISFEDMSTLITQAPKLGLSTTLAHHDRFGQLGDNKGIIGATSAIANKILFQVTVKDAHEFAPEFRKDPPTEMRDEDVYAISQYPFYDLLHGHDNPEVRALIDKCMRPIKERLEDIYGEKETERLLRMDELDMAALYRIDEVMQATRKPQDPSGLEASLARAAVAVLGAAGHTGRLKKLNEEGMLILATIRVINRLFIDVMEGKVKSGCEDFSRMLIDISKIAALPFEDRRVLELYIAIAYGEPSLKRMVPFECAKRQGLCKEYVEKVEQAINTEFETQRAAFAKRIWEMYEKNGEEIVKKNIIMYAEKRIRDGEPEWTAQETEWRRSEESGILNSMCQYAVREYEREEMPPKKDPAYYPVYGLDTLLFLIKDITENFKPLVRRQPNDIIDVLSRMYVSPVRNDLTTRGYKEIVESVDALTKLCELLAKPENHLQVKTRQRGQKAVQTRTIADMTNEMEGELTELWKFTAYAKILQGKEVWKGKITTCPLPDKPYHSHTLKDVICGTSRSYIEEAIRKRQENWMPKPENKPFTISGMPIIEAPDWLLRAMEKPEKTQTGKTESPKGGEKPFVHPDEPPPSRRPKPRR